MESVIQFFILLGTLFGAFLGTIVFLVAVNIGLDMLESLMVYLFPGEKKEPQYPVTGREI